MLNALSRTNQCSVFNGLITIFFAIETKGRVLEELSP